jgi:hypothetical protein
MDTSLDTKQKKRNKKTKKLFLPYTLRGKKLQKSTFPSNKDADCEKYLEQYLETGELDLLGKALKINDSLRAGAAHEVDLKAEEVKRKRVPNYKSEIDSIYVDRLTIVGEVIRALRAQIFFRFGEVIKTPQGETFYRYNRMVADNAKRYLKKLGYPIPEIKAWEIKAEAGLIHRKPYHTKGGTSSFEYLSAPIFIQYWNVITEAVTKSKLRKRYKDEEQDRALLIQHLSEGIPKYLDIEIYTDDIKTFNLKTTKLTTASFIAWRHELLCPLCKRRKKNLSPETIYDLFKKAEEELKESQ